MPPRKPPTGNEFPHTLKVLPLSTPSPEPARTGRPRKRKMPPLPQEIMEGMSPIEQEHFVYFVECTLEENPTLRGTDLIYLNLAGLDYINTLRLQQQQLSSGELVTMSRQHPGVQFRAWVDLLSTSPKARGGQKGEQAEERASQRSLLLGLSGS